MMEAAADQTQLTELIRSYWNDHIHDLEIVRSPIGSAGFFNELAEYRYDKLNYLPKLVNFSGYAGKDVLEIGCGVGIDLVRFASGGAKVTGVDFSTTAIELAEQHFKTAGQEAKLLLMDGEAMDFPDESFDVVFAHGVLQYTADPFRMAREMYRVLRPGGQAIVMMYNRISWLNAMSRLTNVGLEHEDAPVLRKVSSKELRQILSVFEEVQIIPERFPVKSKLHHGLKARLYNDVFVGAFNLLPRSIVRPLGWHLMAFANRRQS
jgi:ubiquinone/menaquinone biosynthesis C-methylase UbiE